MRAGRAHIQTAAQTGRAVLAGTAIALGFAFSPHHAGASEAAKTAPPKADAVNSLRSILQDAVDQGLLGTDQTAPPQQKPSAGEKTSKPSTVSAPSNKPVDKPSDKPAVDCKRAQAADITAYTEVTKFDDVIAAKASLSGTNRAPEGLQAVIMSYLALGLGTEALELSELRDERLLALLAKIIEADVSAADIDDIKAYSGCHNSFRVWGKLAELSQPSLMAAETVITLADYEALTAFPPKLQEYIAMQFAIHAARTGDTLNAKRFLTKHAPETKYGGIAERKDEDLLFLQALILQSKADERFAEIFSHIAAGTGRYKTLALKALSDDAAQSGRALPDEFEGDLTAINNQYGDGHEAKAAAFELVRFRLGQYQYQDAINTAKVQFSTQDALRLKSVGLIGDKLSAEFSSNYNDRRLYALNGYFYDPAFFESYPDEFRLTLLAHDTAAALSLPELAVTLLPKLQSFEDESQKAEVKNSLQLAKAKLAYKTADYVEAVSLLKGFKDGEFSAKLRRDAALASGDRALAQTVLASLPDTPQRDTDYLAFTLQKGLWNESKLQAQTIFAKEKLGTKDLGGAADSEAQKSPSAPLPFAFSVELLDYLSAAPAAADVTAKLPDTSAELDALLLTLKTNTNVAKGFLNYDRSSP